VGVVAGEAAEIFVVAGLLALFLAEADLALDEAGDAGLVRFEGGMAGEEILHDDTLTDLPALVLFGKQAVEEFCTGVGHVGFPRSHEPRAQATGLGSGVGVGPSLARRGGRSPRWRVGLVYGLRTSEGGRPLPMGWRGM
jgi:hypothetical protein